MIAALTFVATATAYSWGCGAGPLTKAQTKPVAGFTIASDPAVLPLGSIVHIEGLGERMSHDTGSAIKGKRIDLFVGSCKEAKAWGRREVTVRVIHKGGR